tara:strand:- start:7333 stop:7722 length:390 start_codon:yes stop_codon:yes gene_type:complete
MQYKKRFKYTKNKYGAVKQTFNGRSYHSKGEAAYAQQLELRKLAGEVVHIKPQHKLPLYVNGDLITSYYIDFKVELADGSFELIEYKGFPTPLWLVKWRLTKALLESGQLKGEDPNNTVLLLKTQKDLR